jgi:hypothetical protein
MAVYKADADIVLSVTVDAEGDGDAAAIEAARADLEYKISTGEISLNDVNYLRDVRISNLRRVS